MKSRLGTILISLVIVLSSLLVGCNAVNPSPVGKVTVTDLLGREVAIPANVTRVIAIGPGALRLYVYAGDPDYVVGVEQMEANSPTGRPYMLANPDLAELPIIGQGGPNNAPDPERILTVAPDVIFSTYATEASVADELQAKTGIPVVVISYGDSGFGVTDLFAESVPDSLELIGQVIGDDAKAQAAVGFLHQALEDLGAHARHPGCRQAHGVRGRAGRQGHAWHREHSGGLFAVECHPCQERGG